jgi:hypothetical protein
VSAPSPADAARELGENWLDRQGRLKQWPTKRRLQRAAVFYLVAKFERSRTYTEPQVNEILDDWAPFRDAPLLRRTLIEERLLERTPDGREYWVA